MAKKNNLDKKRNWIQFIVALITNANIMGFFKGNIFTGQSKKMCVPGLNCYSCPGAFGSCPIGSLQAVIGSMKYNISLYVLGIMSFFGVIFGRFICGWLCPFGFFQDMLYKIPTKKFKVNKKFNGFAKYIKFFILIFFVILFPMFLVNEFNMGKPYFCEFICPAGTLEGGIPLVLSNDSLKSAIGVLFTWKMIILVSIIILSIFIYRPFCRYLCPLGAFYSLFNKISFYKMKIDKDKCIGCKACKIKCKIDIDVYKNPNSLECIRCGLCKKVCPTNAIKIEFIKKGDE